ncbi:MAG: peptidoglycan DD-metalloendopeptidase family protein [Nannocystis sp.]|nr:peptidoglycan DD-metalloendopeptidase family protein [Nannocystis sp.]
MVSATLPLALALTAAPRPADACQYANCQSDGAVQKPGAFAFSLPFKAGEKVRVLSGYGPNAGSSLHCRASDSQCANDWHALDLVLPDHPNFGKGQPVLAAAAGTVLDAGWGTSGWAAYGQRVYIQHDYNGDGHKYISMYAHLDSVSVSKGQKIAKGQALGTLGQSCNQAQSCGNFATPHLHFALHRDSGFGGSGSGGSYGGRAVLPEPIDGYSGLLKGQDLISKNGDEEPPPPPKICEPIPPAEIILADDGPCLTLGGKPENWSHGDGLGGHAAYTPQDVPSPDYAEAGLWLFKFEQAGNYDLWVYSPAAPPNRTGAATYKISYGGGQADKVLVDQAANADTWVHLGTWPFDQGVDHWIRLGDNYEPGHQGKNVVVDDLRIAPAAPCLCDQPGATESQPCGDGGEQLRTCDGCQWSDWSPCSIGTTGGDDTTTDPTTTGPTTTGETTTSGGGTGDSGSGTGDATTTGASAGPTTGDPDTSASGGLSATATATATAGFGEPDPDVGCTCRSGGPTPLAGLGVLILLGLRRRRPA